jgi:signal transduction histidine kinase
MQTTETKLLQSAFEEFVKASDSLSNQYVVLENRITELNREISEKNRELEKARQYLSNILNSLPVGVVVQDGRSTIFTNKEAEKFGWPEFSDRIENVSSRMGEITNGKGCFRWKKSNLSNGSQGKEILVLEDVTEMQKMKERLERDERLRAMGEMAARIAHEIKNPLGSMQLFLGLILKGEVGDKEREYLGSVVFGINTIDRIINNLLSYTRPKTLVQRQERLSRVVKDTLDFMSISIGSRAIDIAFKSSFDEKSWFDPDLLKLSLMNFISNAFEAIDSQGFLNVEVREDGAYTSVMFTDSGAGMSEETRRSIFNPFFTTKDKGVGLGLFIAHNIIQAHGGYIEVESQEGKGSSFTVYLPKERS